MNAISKVIKTLSGADLKEAAKANAEEAEALRKTAAEGHLKDAVKKAREKIDAERNAEEAAASKAAKGG